MIEADHELTPLVVRVFDVGHGDSLLMEFPDGEHVGIVDCHVHRPSQRGAGAKRWDPAEPKVASYLRSRIEAGDPLTVAFICVSHFHDDHYMGLGRTIQMLVENGIPIEEFWDPGIARKKVELMVHCPLRTASLKELHEIYAAMDALCDRGTRYEPLVKVQPSFRRIADVGIDVLAPDSRHWNDYFRFLGATDRAEHSKLYPQTTDEHLICSALLLKYGKGRIILGGDLTCYGWERLLENRGRKPLRSPGVKASHHGSVNGNFLPPLGENRRSLWRRIRIDKHTDAAISGGYRTGLPHQDTIKELLRQGVTVYCTGDPEETAQEDPLDAIPLPSDVTEVYRIDSSAILESKDSFHGDIRVEVGKDGQARVIPELPRPPLQLSSV